MYIGYRYVSLLLLDILLSKPVIVSYPVTPYLSSLLRSRTSYTCPGVGAGAIPSWNRRLPILIRAS